MKKGRTYAYNDQHIEVFTKLKSLISSLPKKYFLNYSLPIFVRTDASEEGTSAELFQIDGGVHKCVAFHSHKFNDTERNWSTIEQECFAIVLALKAWAHLISGVPLIIQTDHRNLQYMQQSTVKKLIRWRLELAEFEFSIEHIPGKSNIVADGISRCFTVLSSPTPVDPSNPSTDLVRSTSLPTPSPVDPHPSSSSGARPPSPSNTPHNVTAIIGDVHNSIVGHHGIDRTLELLKQKHISWPKMSTDVQNFISDCGLCQKFRLGTASLAAALHSSMVTQPFEVLAMDTTGPFPADLHGNKYVIVAMDAFTRFVELFAVPSTDAQDLASCVISIIGRYGCPKSIRSDHGPQYDNILIDELLRLLDIQHQFSIPYRPQANGLVERCTGETNRHLRLLIKTLHQVPNWSLFLPLVQRILNSNVHSAINVAPARLMFGDKVDLHRGIITAFPDPVMSTAEDLS